MRSFAPFEFGFLGHNTFPQSERPCCFDAVCAFSGQRRDAQLSVVTHCQSLPWSLLRISHRLVELPQAGQRVVGQVDQAGGDRVLGQEGQGTVGIVRSRGVRVLDVPDGQGDGSGEKVQVRVTGGLLDKGWLDLAAHRFDVDTIRV